jgi:hypothetical protein
MRFLGAILMCLGAAGLTPCFADPPVSTAAATSQPATPATNAASTPASAPAPATQAAPATSQAAAPAAKAASAPAATAAKATSTTDAEERQLMNAGYTPEMHNGTKLWCRREQELGSRLGSRQKVCGTAEELTVLQRQAQQQFQQQMPATYSTNPGK